MKCKRCGNNMVLFDIGQERCKECIQDLAILAHRSYGRISPNVKPNISPFTIRAANSTLPVKVFVG